MPLDRRCLSGYGMFCWRGSSDSFGGGVDIWMSTTTAATIHTTGSTTASTTIASTTIATGWWGYGIGQ